MSLKSSAELSTLSFVDTGVPYNRVLLIDGSPGTLSYVNYGVPFYGASAGVTPPVPTTYNATQFFAMFD